MTLLFADFSKAFDSIYSGKMEQILLAYNLPKETVVAIIMLDKNTKARWRHRHFLHCRRCSPRKYISLIPIHNLPRLRTSNVNRFNEGKWLYTGKARSKQYPAQTITNADYADDIALLANTLAQAESLQHSL